MAEGLGALPDDVDSLKRLVVEALSALQTKTLEVEKLKVELLRLRRLQFGRSSEKLARQIAQLELALEELEQGEAAQTGTSGVAETSAALDLAPAVPPEKPKPARRPLPAHLPREEVVHAA